MHDGVLVGPLLKQSLLIILFLLFQADVAVMVVNATRGEFEAGFDSGGQTREHAVLVRSLGVSQLIVAVNKLDTVDWSQDRFIFIVEKLKQFLKVNIQKIDTY
jgi:translation elongation factor EF-1alpha